VVVAAAVAAPDPGFNPIMAASGCHFFYLDIC